MFGENNNVNNQVSGCTFRALFSHAHTTPHERPPEMVIHTLMSKRMRTCAIRASTHSFLLDLFACPLLSSLSSSLSLLPLFLSSSHLSLLPLLSPLSSLCPLTDCVVLVFSYFGWLRQTCSKESQLPSTRQDVCCLCCLR